METISEGDRPRDLRLEFQYRLIPGVTRLKHYGTSLVKKLWPATVLEDVYEIWEKLNRISHKEPRFMSIHPAVRLKYKLESNLARLKRLGKLTNAEMNKHLNDYQNDLEKLNNQSQVDFHNIGEGNILATGELPSVKMEIEEADMTDNDKSVATMGSSTNYHNLSNFLNESSNNINLLEPEINIMTLSMKEEDCGLLTEHSQLNVGEERNDTVSNSPTCGVTSKPSNVANETSERVTTHSSASVQVDKSQEQCDYFDDFDEEAAISLLEYVESCEDYTSQHVQSTPASFRREVRIMEDPNGMSTTTGTGERAIDSTPSLPLEKSQKECDDDFGDDFQGEAPISSLEYVEGRGEHTKQHSAPIPGSLYPEVRIVEGPNEPSEATYNCKELRESESISYSPLVSPSIDNSTSKTDTNVETSTSSSLKFIANQSNKEGSTSSSNLAKRGTKKRNKRFVPPKKLSRKEIQEEFAKQDRELYETSMATNDYSAYLHKVLHRPSVKQVQRMEHLVYGRRTEQGVEIIPAKPKPPKKNKFRRLLSSTSTSMDVSIFSDRNARTFETFVNSDERDVTKFRFLANSPNPKFAASTPSALFASKGNLAAPPFNFNPAAPSSFNFDPATPTPNLNHDALSTSNFTPAVPTSNFRVAPSTSSVDPVGPSTSDVDPVGPSVFNFSPKAPSSFNFIPATPTSNHNHVAASPSIPNYNRVAATSDFNPTAPSTSSFNLNVPSRFHLSLASPSSDYNRVAPGSTSNFKAVALSTSTLNSAAPSAFNVNPKAPSGFNFNPTTPTSNHNQVAPSTSNFKPAAPHVFNFNPVDMMNNEPNHLDISHNESVDDIANKYLQPENGRSSIFENPDPYVDDFDI